MGKVSQLDNRDLKNNDYARWPERIIIHDDL